jgi:hypothetical protein
MLVSLVGAFGQSAPVNDNFTNRIPVTGSPLTITGTLAGATYEGGETNVFPYSSPNGGGSVWWTWTASQSTTVVIEMLRDYSVVSSGGGFEIYTGTNLSGLTFVDGNLFDGPPGRYVTFPASAGLSYQFRVYGAWGGPFTLKLIATNPLVFLKQPQDCVVSPHGSALFSAHAAGRLQSWRAYQWTFNGIPIPGEIYPVLVIHDVSSNQAGSYSVIATNLGGTTESAAAILTVTETNPVPRIAALSPSSPALLSFSLTGEGGRWYEYESSQDLQTWVSPVWIQPTNATTFLSIPRLGPTHFVRASLNASTDACVAQLKRMRAAFDMFAIEYKYPSSAAVPLWYIQPFIPLTSQGLLPPCPGGGIYSGPSTILGNPTCSLHGRGHEISDP